MINEKANVATTKSACTYDTTYFNTPVFNTVVKCGSVVHVVFLAQIKAAIPNATAILTGLPWIFKSYATRTPYLISDNEYVDTPSYAEGGTLLNSTVLSQAIVSSYAVNSSYVGKYLYLDFTYIAAE